MGKTLYRKVGIASAIMMGSVFLSRVIGLFREMVIAWAGGAGAEVDAYQVAFVVPEILNHIVASGFLSVTFIPIFSRYLSEGREKEGWDVFSVVLNTFGLPLAALIALGVVYTPLVVPLVAPGLRDPAHLAAAVRMTRIVLPAQFFFFAGGLFMAVQFARERFAVPALAPLVYNLGIIGGGVLLGPRLGMEGFAWGALAGAGLGNFAIQFWGARRAGMRWRPGLDFAHPDLRHYVVLTLPLMLGLTMTFSTEFFLKFFGSFLPPGSIAALNYGLRVMLILVGLFGQAVGVASFPFMARLAVEGRLGDMNELLNRTLRWLTAVIPLSVLFIVLRREVVTVLFRRGRFDETAVALTASVLPFLLAGAVAFAAQTVVTRGWYAVQNTLFPAVFGSLAVVLSLPAYVAGMKMFGIRGVAMAVSFSALLQVAVLFALWNRRSGNTGGRRVYGAFARMAILGVAVAPPLELVRRGALALAGEASVPGSIFISAAVGAAFVPLFLAAGALLGVKEARELLLRRAPAPAGTAEPPTGQPAARSGQNRKGKEPT